jgi:electron transport complex protein RnfD
MDENKSMYMVSSSPHIRSDEDTRSVMIDVIVALLPALAMGVAFFGWRALTLALVGVSSCIAFEYLYAKFMKKTVRIGDFSAVATGLLLTLNLSAAVPYWMVVVGSFFAIVVVKQLFGGIGKNFMNPALAARVFLFSWPAAMTTWPQPLSEIKLPILSNPVLADVITTATPLASLKDGRLPDTSLFDMALGNIGGCIGEVSTFMLLMGGLYLIFRGVISPRIPASFLGTVALLTFIFPKGPDPLLWVAYNLLSGGLMLGAIFMATDYSTSPVSGSGKIIFGVGCGALTIFMRYFGSYPEGVSFAILIMNTTVWFIDHKIMPRRFGSNTMKQANKAKAGDVK